MVEGQKGPDKIGLRKMTPGDIPYGMKLKSLAGWNQLEADWEMLLEADGDNFIASLDGENAGIVVSVPYHHHFTWIAMVLVDPGARRKGVGKALMNKSIELARAKGPIRLDATPEGFELYRTLGFQSEYELVRYIKSPDESPMIQNRHNSAEGIPLGYAEMASVIALDKPVFGADRSGILRSMYMRNPEYAFCRVENGSIKAYCLGRSGSQFEHIGPIISENTSYAAELLAVLMPSLVSKDVAIDVFADKPDWITVLEDCGFTKQRSFTRMCLGNLHQSGITDKQFAIAGPEFG